MNIFEGSFVVGKVSRRQAFEDQIRLFESYLEDMESFLAEEAERAETADLIEPEPAEDEDELELAAIEVPDWFRLEELEAFADILRSSFFANLYSFLEFQIEEECRRRKNVDVSLELSDISGSGITRARTYFSKVLGVSFPADGVEWKEIKHYRSLRNCFVHSRGRLDRRQDEKSLRKYVESKRSLRIERDTVHLQPEFCSEAYNVIKSFLSLLLFSNEPDESMNTVHNASD